MGNPFTAHVEWAHSVTYDGRELGNDGIAFDDYLFMIEKL